MTALIALIAAAIVWLLTMKPRQSVVCILLSAALVGGGTAVVQRYMKYEVLDPAMVEQHHTPTIHWIMMSIPTGDNPYGGATGDYGITWGMMEDGASRADIMDSIYARMKDRIYALRYPNRLGRSALRKNSAFIGDGTFGMTEMLDDGPVRENAVSSFVLEGRAHYGAYGALTTGIWLAQLTLALAACVRDIRRRDVSGAMLYVAFFGRDAVPDALGSAKPLSVRLCAGAASCSLRAARSAGRRIRCEKQNRRLQGAAACRHGADDSVLSVHGGQHAAFPMAAV